MRLSKYYIESILILFGTTILGIVACLDLKNRQTKIVPEFTQFLNTKHQDTFDLCLLDFQVFEGSHFLEGLNDILIHNGNVEFVGDIALELIQVKQVIKGDSLSVASPGFIDLHAHGNPLKDSEFQNFLSMGVTTICLGQDGTSPNYDDIGEWMDLVNQKDLGVNIAMFVGHGTLRLLSDVLYKKKPLPSDHARMDTLLVSALKAGCFGMTTGLEYSPGKFADSSELIQLAKRVGQYGGVLMSHIRNEDNDQLMISLDELIKLGEYCKVHVSHLKSVYGKGSERGQEVVEYLEQASTQGINITADQYPYLASYTSIGIIFPDWAKPPNVYEYIVQKRNRELKEFLAHKVKSRNGPESTLFGSGKYKGLTLAQVTEIQGKPFEEILIEIGPFGASAAYFIMDKDLQTSILKSKLVGIGSDGSPTMYHPRGYGTHAKIIQEFVMSESILSLAEALYKMTELPADILNLSDRGRITPGQNADIVIFNPDNVKANASFTDPHQLATGFDFVIVNGIVALDHGDFAQLNGKILKRDNLSGLKK